MGLTNVEVMIPFCRTVAEGRSVLAVMAESSLNRSENGLEVRQNGLKKDTALKQLIKDAY